MPRESVPAVKPAFSPPPARLAYGRREVARLLDISTRTLDRMIATGEFPKPDRHAGRKPIWSVRTIEGWLHGNPPARPGVRRKRQPA